MSYYPESDSHARDKVKVVLGLSKYATKKELEPFTCTDTSDLLAKTKFLPEKMKYYLGIEKLTNV